MRPLSLGWKLMVSASVYLKTSALDPLTFERSFDLAQNSGQVTSFRTEDSYPSLSRIAWEETPSVILHTVLLSLWLPVFGRDWLECTGVCA